MKPDASVITRHHRGRRTSEDEPVHNMFVYILAVILMALASVPCSRTQAQSNSAEPAKDWSKDPDWIKTRYGGWGAVAALLLAETMSVTMLAIARRRLELGPIALLPLLGPPLLCSLAVALGIAFLIAVMTALTSRIPVYRYLAETD